MSGRSVLAMSAVILFSAAASAADLKVGVVNVREVFARYSKAEELRKENEADFIARQRDLQRRQRELVRQVAELQQGAGLELEEAGRAREIKKLELEDALLKLDYRELQQDMQAATERLMLLVSRETTAATRRLAEAEGFDLVFKVYGAEHGASDREALEAFQSDALLYISPRMDITSRVLEVLENAHRRGIKLVQ